MLYNMTKDIDVKYNQIKAYDELAATVWLDRVYWFLNYNEIAEYLRISTSKAKQLYRQANYILDHQDVMWVDGLSKRSRFALLRHGFRDLKTLIHQVEEEGLDLKSIDGVGDMVENEIRRWLNRKGCRC